MTITIPDAVFKEEIKRFQRLFPRKTVAEIAEHYRMDTATGIRVLQDILAEKDMRRYRPGIESVAPVRTGRRGASRMAP